MRILNSTLALGALLVAGPMMAQTAASPFSVSGALVGGFDDLKKATNRSTGFIVGGAFDFQIPNSEVPVRASLNYQVLPGKTDKLGLKTSLQSIQLAGDVFVNTPVQKLKFLVGLSLQKYSVKNTGDTLDASGNLIKAFPVDTDKGIKMGARVGFEYRFTPHWNAELLCQVTELGSSPESVQNKPKNSPAVGQGGINPSWAQLGVRYHF